MEITDEQIQRFWDELTAYFKDKYPEEIKRLFADVRREFPDMTDQQILRVSMKVLFNLEHVLPEFPALGLGKKYVQEFQEE